MSNKIPTPPPGGEVAVYETPDGNMRVDVKLEQETVWLTQRQMAEVFSTTVENVLMHLNNVFSSKELEAEATIKDYLVVQTEGKRQIQRNIKHYNLDAIISVGYRVNSRRGVYFRQWATHTLRDHKEYLAISNKPCSENHSIEPVKKRQCTFSTLSSKIIHSPMATNASALFCSCSI